MAADELRGEKERNRLLRRTDWRFLLPNPMPARSICFTQGYLARALAQVSELVLPCDRSASPASLRNDGDRNWDSALSTAVCSNGRRLAYFATKTSPTD